MSDDTGDRTVALVGDGPALEAVRATLGDTAVPVAEREPDGLEAGPTLAVAVGTVDGRTLRRANRVAVGAGTPLVAVEVGGAGGRPTEGPGTVAVLAPDGPCYECLRARTAATTAGADTAPDVPAHEVRFAGAVAGRLAVGHLEGTETGGTLVSLPDRRRGLLPVPGCPVCSGAGRTWTPTLSARETTVEEVADRAERAVDELLGPVAVVGERESYPAPYYLARLVATEGISDASAGPQAAGVAADWDAAYVKAVGEALERYCAGVYRTGDLLEAPAQALPDAVSPTAFVLPPDADPPEPTEPSRWVPGVELGTGRSVRLPAGRVLFPPPDRTLGAPVTTGLGLGSSTVEAVRSGLTEVLERDATMTAWYSTYEPVGLAVEDEAYAALARRAQSEGLAVTATLVTGDVDVPVVAATVHRETWPRFAAGSAAGLDADRAARGALAEAVQNWMELRALGRERASEAGAAVAAYADDPSPVAELTEPDPVLPAADAGPTDPPTGAAALEALLERCGAADLSVYASRTTTRDVAALGFEAVRVLVPAAQPLFVDEPYFGERARSVPAGLGYEARLDRRFHPYP